MEKSRNHNNQQQLITCNLSNKPHQQKKPKKKERRNLYRRIKVESGGWPATRHRQRGQQSATVSQEEIQDSWYTCPQGICLPASSGWKSSKQTAQTSATTVGKSATGESEGVIWQQPRSSAPERTVSRSKRNSIGYGEGKLIVGSVMTAAAAIGEIVERI